MDNDKDSNDDNLVLMIGWLAGLKQSLGSAKRKVFSNRLPCDCTTSKTEMMVIWC